MDGPIGKVVNWRICLSKCRTLHSTSNMLKSSGTRFAYRTFWPDSPVILHAWRVFCWQAHSSGPAIRCKYGQFCPMRTMYPACLHLGGGGSTCAIGLTSTLVTVTGGSTAYNPRKKQVTTTNAFPQWITYSLCFDNKLDTCHPPQWRTAHHGHRQQRVWQRCQLSSSLYPIWRNLVQRFWASIRRLPVVTHYYSAYYA